MVLATNNKLVKQKYKPPIPTCVMRAQPINLFDSGHMSIDVIKSTYLSAAIHAEEKHLSRTKGAERTILLGAEGSAGVPPARFHSTPTAIYARTKPGWWHGAAPLELPSRIPPYDGPPIDYFPTVTEKRNPSSAPGLSSHRMSLADTASALGFEVGERAPTPDLSTRPGFAKRTVAPKVTRVQHATWREPTAAPLGIAHALPNESGQREYFMRRPADEEYAHGLALMRSRGIRADPRVAPDPIEPSRMAVKVTLVSGPDAAVLGPAPFRADAPVHEAVLRRMASAPTGKITGDRLLHDRGYQPFTSGAMAGIPAPREAGFKQKHTQPPISLSDDPEPAAPQQSKNKAESRVREVRTGRLPRVGGLMMRASPEHSGATCACSNPRGARPSQTRSRPLASARRTCTTRAVRWPLCLPTPRLAPDRAPRARMTMAQQRSNTEAWIQRRARKARLHRGAPKSPCRRSRLATMSALWAEAPYFDVGSF
jgi:hypothetical protein